ncbi:WavE lipopolysaccharide synthesis family protein [Alcanivorax sp. JB21]|uniref:WavE lipopolysaccharide synthesis family protein n=1 Tax=Alcanivorax limicola TaxID=2874102 RepID=UPI001CBF27D8|nr:WavE lipopolysaccharide synthesis family protein [Alcanivorax limicola]MBZ2190303.1 WavE lipopolysaccharide synthesis family protein [Alcanivorax limicola]
MISSRDVTVVVQGPVHTFRGRPQEDGITQRCLASVRHHLPRACLILSTWEGQELSGLDYDELILNPDPGGNIVSYRKDGAARRLNHNRQIVSTVQGLRRVSTPYAMKLRSDNALLGSGFIDLQQRFTKRCADMCWLRERVVLANTFTRKFAKGRRVLFHASDFFAFGLAEDVLNLWDLPLFDDLDADGSFLAAGQPYYPGAPEYPRDATQDLFLRFVNKHVPASLAHLLDGDEKRLRQSELILANNFIVAEPERIGLYLGRKFLHGVRTAKRTGRSGFYTYAEWQALYQRYCDPEYEVQDSFSERLMRMLVRLYGVWLKRLNASFSLGRRKLAYRRAMGRHARN